MKSFIITLLLATAVFSQDLDGINNITEFIQSEVGSTLNFEYYTGYIPVGDNNAKRTSLFFSLSTKVGETLDKTSPDTPVIFWFNGGPGCSSQYGNFQEVGPIYVDENEKLVLREYSWNKQALLVFTDQPLNVGFSYTDQDIMVSSTPEATRYFKKYITGFYKQFPHLISNPTYFFGESFAGHYIPSFANMVITDKPVTGLNFQGVGIGDGMTDPYHQFESYADYLYDLSLAGQAQKQKVQKKQNDGQQDIKNQNYSDASGVFDDITGELQQYGNFDEYNVFYYQDPSWNQQDPKTITYYSKLLHNKDFATKYGVPSYVPEFIDCNNPMYYAFYDDITRSYEKDVVNLLDNDVNVVLYNGQLDFIINAPGAQDWINKMSWSHTGGWQSTKKKVWKETNSKNVWGNYQQYLNFNYINVFKAGHMVPSDQPAAAYEMLTKTLSWDW